MKKLLIIILIFLISFSTIIFVYSKPKNNSIEKEYILNNGIIEHNKIIISEDNDDKKEINITYTIPNNFDAYNIYLTPSIFYLISKKSIHNIDQTTINIYIKNNSNHIYSYMNKSISIKSNQNMESWNENTYKNNILPSNGLPTIYRTYNSALQALFNNENNLNNLTDNNINNKLLDLGYNGIDDLLLYYLDFYNENSDIIGDNTIYDIFSGKTSNILETNSNILTLGYHWVYDKIVTIRFSNQKYYNDDLTIYSIGNYMRNDDLANPYFMESFMDILKHKDYSLQKIMLNINYQYYLPAFKDFIIEPYISFSLERLDFNDL